MEAPNASLYRFDLLDEAGWRTHLDEEGYAVIAGVLTEGETADATSQIWAAVEAEHDGVGAPHIMCLVATCTGCYLHRWQLTTFCCRWIGTT
jgi:hypothetical protein